MRSAIQSHSSSSSGVLINGGSNRNNRSGIMQRSFYAATVHRSPLVLVRSLCYDPTVVRPLVVVRLACRARRREENVISDRK